MAAGGKALASAHRPASAATSVARLAVRDFRNCASAELHAGPGPVVLVGANGAGKTNLLEAVSLLVPGRGLRGAAMDDLTRRGGCGDWAVAATIDTATGMRDLRTGPSPRSEGANSSGRCVRVDGTDYGSPGILGELVEMLWLTPAMDGLFAGPASDRRRFLDRLVICFNHGYRTSLGRFERAMRQRNRLLADGVRDNARFDGLEIAMAESAVAVAAARAEVVARVGAMVDVRRIRDPGSPFPWSVVALQGLLETSLAVSPAVEVEDDYRGRLRDERDLDRAAGRTRSGPHRSDLVVQHGPKGAPAAISSTGEQKALLIGLVLAHAELLAQRDRGVAPIVLLDEVAAHLDERRREALYAEILRLGAQTWMTGAELAAFAPILSQARVFRVEEGRVTVL